MKDSNYYIIYGWMINKLNLNGNELLLYAIIYGFNQDGNGLFSGSLSYLQNSIGASRPTIINCLKNLISKGLLEKVVLNKNVEYKVITPQLEVSSKESLPLGGKEILLGGKETLPEVVKKFNRSGKETLPNNNIYNNINNNTTIVDEEENQDLDFFKRTPIRELNKFKKYSVRDLAFSYIADDLLVNAILSNKDIAINTKKQLISFLEEFNANLRTHAMDERYPHTTKGDESNYVSHVFYSLKKKYPKYRYDNNNKK